MQQNEKFEMNEVDNIFNKIVINMAKRFKKLSYLSEFSGSDIYCTVPILLGQLCS